MQRLGLAPLIFALCAVTVMAAPKSSKGEKSNWTWSPAQYDASATRLPSNYQGTDFKRFHELFAARSKTLKKGEFETSEEFAKRTADVESVLAPISTRKLYAFRINKITPAYDADSQNYQFRNGLGRYSCEPAGSIGEDRGTLVCLLGRVTRHYDKYTGSNAYGASRLITRVVGTDLALALPNTPGLFGAQTDSQTIFDYPDGDGSVRLVDKLPVPVEQAKALKDNIGILFVGYVMGAQFVQGRALIVEPKIDNPQDIFIETDALPFDLKRVVYYEVSSGKILALRTFD